MENKESVFVNVLGWIMIIFCGFGLLISVLQNIMINVAFPIEEMQESLNNTSSPGGFPTFLFSNIRLVFVLFGIVILAGLIISVAFLKRKNWARIGLIILFGIGIIYNLGSLIYQWLFIDSINNDFPQSQNDFGNMMLIMKIFMTLFTFGFIVLFAWLIKKLTSENIKLEFGNTPHNRG